MVDERRFAPIRPVRSYERIVEQIENAIVGGRLRSGQFLPSERDMMQQFSVSRSTVREAMRVLESDGLIRSRPGNPNGAEVLGLSPRALRKSVDRLIQGDRIRLAELVQFRMVLEGTANLLAARLRTEDDLADLEDALAAMRAGMAAGYEEFGRADLRFHDLVARASRNALIQLCSEVVRDVVLDLIKVKLASAPRSEELMGQSLAHHEEVFDAIRRGDSQAAEAIARANLVDYYAEYLPAEDAAVLQLLSTVRAAGLTSQPS